MIKHPIMPDPLPLLARLPRGSLVVMRHYAVPDRARLASKVAAICRTRRLVFLLAGDWRTAMTLGVGLHLPEGLARTMPPAIRLWHRNRGLPLSIAAHSRTALVRAKRQGADAAFVSPVFPTKSHPDATPLGPLAFRGLVRGCDLAIYALGGVTANTVGRLRRSGAIGVATVGGLSPSSA